MAETQKYTVRLEDLDTDFSEAVVKAGGERVHICLQCGVCAASCPIFKFNEALNPRIILRSAVLGLTNRTLYSNSIWLCAACYSCTERCPHGVQPTEVIRDSLIEATGAKCVNYVEKRLCCGAPIMGVDEKLSLEIVRDKLKSIQNVGVNAIVTICPFCHTHFDLNQVRLKEDYGETYGMSVLHYTQLLGLAQGYGSDDLGLYENRVPVDDLLGIV